MSTELHLGQTVWMRYQGDNGPNGNRGKLVAISEVAEGSYHYTVETASGKRHTGLTNETLSMYPLITAADINHCMPLPSPEDRALAARFLDYVSADGPGRLAQIESEMADAIATHRRAYAERACETVKAERDEALEHLETVRCFLSYDWQHAVPEVETVKRLRRAMGMTS